MASSRFPMSPSKDGRGRNFASMLGFQFRDPSLFERALVHRSYCNEHGMDASDSYERLEFLGDAVLELIVSDSLYVQFPEADEGQLTKSRSSVVRGKVLAGVARRLGLGEMLLVGHGVESSGGRDQESVLAAALEAVIAAVYLDQGMETARQFVDRHLAPELADIGRSGAPPENPKSRLQELLQGRGHPTPSYRLIGREGPDHSPVFSVEALVGEQILGIGEGGRKSEAEHAAAKEALENILSGSCSLAQESNCTGNSPSKPNTEVENRPADCSRVARGGILNRLRLTRKG